VLRAEMDMAVGVTACSAGLSNNGSFKPIETPVSTPLRHLRDHAQARRELAAQQGPVRAQWRRCGRGAPRGTPLDDTGPSFPCGRHAVRQKATAPSIIRPWNLPPLRMLVGA